MKKRIGDYFPESKILLLSHSGSKTGKNRERKEANNTTTQKRGWPTAVAAISTPQVLRYGEATDLERTQHKDEEEDNTPTRDNGDGDNTGGLKRGRSKYRPIFHFFHCAANHM
jgi:hypothetical protein